ncbi:MAG: macrolide ABC transporter ATP-binding protein [Deltaproteobacteria bacterium RBG_16_71_12]|nr:MAG: macrolide ABC transporter ATP-binding protein [Deltaproteobacteria bacterium RBG_16_71_12]
MTLVEARALTKIYRMGGEVVRALDGVDLTIDKGELIAIVGASGSGKSTLMNLLGCLDTPTSGSYHLAGIPVDQLDDEQLAEVRNRHIGFVFQSFHLLARQSALDNVVLPLVYRRTDALPPEERRRRARAVLDKVGLADRMQHKPTELSGGQRQRVAIARALINDPTLLFADEPTGNLDSKTSEEILALLVALNREHGRTIVIVTHEPDVARRCDRTVQLKDGRVLHDTRVERTAVTHPPGAP